ncbi:multicopper oxidase domain-containing protein [Mucilaginibacter sp. McL0603]|uniref:multicopper oxidase domain-containing protein n=1 Tax=Mucilaginibacter sp. McL0603 TaxID=3415670 RepID=UPI003CF2309F
MKKIFLLIISGLITSVAFAQMPMNMPMPKAKTAAPKPSQQVKPASERKEQATGSDISGGKTVRYDLYISDTIVNYTGKKRRAIAANGSIPMPTLYFTEGDTAEIYVHNTLKEETIIHWHGVILPNQYDGVPYLTTQPIAAGKTHLFKFPIVQNGTYWYHSHQGLQQQSGMYGALIFRKRDEAKMKEYTMVLSDWADMNPKEINRSLHNQTDWFSIQKGTTQSYAEAIRSGNFNTKLANEWKRMNAMDVSDVAYDRFLINGKNVNEQPQFKAGDSMKLRVVNGGSSSYFWLTWAGVKITVVANDGEDVEPVEVDRLIIAPAETYDLVVNIPKAGSYEFLATPEDRTKSASLWLGKGPKVSARHLPKLKYFEGMKMMNGMMDMSGNMKQMDGMQMSNQVMDMNTVMYPEISGPEKSGNKMKGMPGMDTGKDSAATKKRDDMAGMDMSGGNSDIVTLSYGMLKATKKTTLPKQPTKELYFELTGNMNRYVWTINNKTVSESDKILIHHGENVRIILYNNTMMRHPMHLHGHQFRVLNGQGDFAPMKNTLDIMPMERDTIEFAATESGDWFFHCHILYHMMSGMGRIFSYENSPPNPEVPDPAMGYRMVQMDDRMPHFMARVGLESNGSDGQVVLANTRWQASSMWHLGLNDKMGYESETMIGRYIGKMQWLFPYAGFDYHYKQYDPNEKNIFGSELKNMFGQVSNKDNRHTVVAGLAYTLPMLFVADARIDGDGKLRFQLSRQDVPISKRLRFSIMLNTDKEYMAGLRYIVTKYFSLSTHYDSDMGLGGGLTLTY